MIREKLEILGAFLVDKLKNELMDQGHKNTGNLSNSMRYEVKQNGNEFELNIYAAGYSKFLEQGIGAGNYVSVEALAIWVEQKGIATGEKEIKNAAFAIREKIFQEGSPTKGSFQFSKNGRRKGFINAVIKGNEKMIVDELFKAFKESAIVTLSNAVNQHQQTFES